MADGSDSREWGPSDAKGTASRTTIITGGGYPGTGLVVAHRRERGQAELPARSDERNRQARLRRATGNDSGQQLRSGDSSRSPKVRHGSEAASSAQRTTMLRAYCRSRNARAVSTNSRWNWKMPPWPASG